MAYMARRSEAKVRVARLAADNRRTQGAERRAWYRRHNREHLNTVSTLVEDALRVSGTASTRQTVILGAGACTEIPLARLARVSAHVLLVDLDVAGMAQARDELPATLRDRVDLLQADLTGGVSEALAAELQATLFADLNLLDQGRGMAQVEAAADCLERCPVPDAPMPVGLQPGGYELVISDLVLTQLYSLPLLDVIDTLTAYAPAIVDLRATLPRYHNAANGFRRRIALAHLALLRELLTLDGVVLLLSDRAGELLPPKAGPHARDPVERLETLPESALAIPDDLERDFTLAAPLRMWRWLISAPDAERPGRRYDAFGVLVRPRGSNE
jgi:hypothetical protein